MTAAPPIARLARHFAVLDPRPEVERLPGGLINDSYKIAGAGGSFVLQRLSPIFDPRIHHNIEAALTCLAAAAVTAPALVRTVEGALWADLDGDGSWRLMTFMPGTTESTLARPAQARSLGLLVGRTHRALEDLDHEFVALRHGVHDTPHHLARFEGLLRASGDHRLFAAVERLAGPILEHAASLPQVGALPVRVCHGDLKVSNGLFDGDEALCLVDWDTVAPMPLWQELGDAWRSWCNPTAEDAFAPRFDLELFRASWQGYLAGLGRSPSPQELDSLVIGVEWISLELAVRFAADALAERYFGWDAQRYPGRGEHNLARAASQWRLCAALSAARGEREAILRHEAGEHR
jgi:Ser/Thr protein kinase RdoA (MazF antagonist)